MSRRDPTLPATTPEETALIARVKGAQDSDALMALVDRNTGIYFDVVNRYAATYPNAIRARDLDDDKLFNLYTFICAYDPARGMKLSTYIGDRTDYLCKTLLKKAVRNPISPGLYSGTGAMPLDTDEDTYTTTDGAHVTLEDESAAVRVVEVADRDLSLEDVKRAAAEVCHDPRFIQILDYRHLRAEHGALSWREVGHKVGLSHEGARKVYTHNLALIRAHLVDSP